MQKVTFSRGPTVILVAALMAAVLLGECAAADDASTGTATGAPPAVETNEAGGAGAAQVAGPPPVGEADTGPETDAAAVEMLRVGPGSELAGGDTDTAASPVPLLPATVTRVVDGDTVYVRLNDGSEEKVRFIGVDTPESTTQVEPSGEEAAAYTKSRLDGEKIYLELDVGEGDKYGRLLAYVWLQPPKDDGETDVRAKMFNAELLLSGMAQVMTVPPNVKYTNLFLELEREARESEKGLGVLPVGGK